MTTHPNHCSATTSIGAKKDSKTLHVNLHGTKLLHHGTIVKEDATNQKEGSGHGLSQNRPNQHSTVDAAPQVHQDQTILQVKTFQDELDFKKWLSEASVGSSEVFDVMKTCCKHLHEICERLEIASYQGLKLEHKSTGTGKKCCLIITISAMPAN